MRKSLVFLLAVFIGLTTPAFAEEPQSFSAHFRAYNAAIEEGDFRLALTHAEEAYRLGLAQFGRGSKEHAVLAYNLGYVLNRNTEALGAISSENVESLVNASTEKRGAKFLLESIDIFEKLYGNNAVELIDPILELANFR